MKKITLLIAMYIGINFGFSQFVLKGTVEGYVNKSILLYKKGATDLVYIETVSTDQSGTFSYKIPYEFRGIISLLFAKEKVYHDFFCDNKDITFLGKLKGEHFNLQTIKSEINEAYTYIEQNEMINYKLLYLTELSNLYNNNESFKQNINTEITRLKSSEVKVDVEKFPLLSYVQSIKQLTETQPESQEETAKTLTTIKNHLLNDGEELEQSGMLKSLIMPYINYSISGSTSREDQVSLIKTSVQDLITETDIETSRGQNILLAIHEIFESYDELKSITKTYFDQLSHEKCEVSPALKTKLNYHSNLQIGKAFPAISFTKNSNQTKYKRLSDIKSDYKLIVIWASWCPHCQKEKAEIQNFYAPFKNDKKGEIISYALETNTEEYKEFHKDITWIYDSDIKYWSTPHAEVLNVTSTPTFFILDKNNNLLAIKNNIKEVKEFLKM